MSTPAKPPAARELGLSKIWMLAGLAVLGLLVALGALLLPAASRNGAARPGVAAAITADPARGSARGTMVMVHAGGWAGHDARAQQLLMKIPGDFFRKRGWRVVSIDYDEGADGLQDVLDTVESEVTRRTSDGPVCIYGESSGGHLALVAAARLPAAVDCVIGLGTPTDLAIYRTDGAVSDNPQVRLLASRIGDFFGTTTDELEPWNPVSLAPSIRARVLLMQQADDRVVAGAHAMRFDAAHPATKTVALQAGAPAKPAQTFLHGTISDAGRRQYAAAIGSFADVAVAASN